MLYSAVRILFMACLLFFQTLTAEAAQNDSFLAQMKVTREINLGSTYEYEVDSIGRGRAILKNPPFRLKQGEAINIFVTEGAPENGRAAYIVLKGGGARSFKEGLAAVSFGGSWSFIDKNGRLISQMGFGRTGDFKNGFALFENDNAVGFVGKNGKILNTPALGLPVYPDEIFNHKTQAGFNEGLAVMLALTKNGEHVPIILDTTGAVTRISKFPKLKIMRPFSEGLSAVLLDINGDPWSLFGFIDSGGKLVIPARFLNAYSFSDGMAAVIVPSDESKYQKRWGFIDKAGNLVIEPTYEAAQSFSGGLAAFKSGGKWGFIDKSGVIKANAIYDEVLPFSDGLAAVKRGGMWGYINKNGQVTIKFLFTAAKSFVNGLAPVATESFPVSVWGYIDKAGKFVIQQKYETAEPYSDGLALVSESMPGSGTKWKYINSKGQAALWFYSYR